MKTGRPPKHPDDRASRLISVRVTEDTYSSLAQEAARRGETVSTYVVDALTMRLSGGDYDPDRD